MTTTWLTGASSLPAVCSFSLAAVVITKTWHFCRAHFLTQCSGLMTLARQWLIACSHRWHGQDKTVYQSCLVRVGGVNTTADKTIQFCLVRLVSTQFPICSCSVSNILRITKNIEIGNWVETRQNSSKLDQDKTKLSCFVRVGGVNKL